MFVAPFLFEHLIKWFHNYQNKYDFLCLFLVGNKPENKIISQEILKDRLFIDRVTGSNICFFFCGTSAAEGFCEDFNKWNFINKDELYQWSVRRFRFGGSWEDFSESFREDVCSRYQLQRSILPALIFIDKENRHFLYRVHSYKDIQSLFTPLGIISDYIKDRASYKYTDCRSYFVEQLQELGFDRESIEFIADSADNDRVSDWLIKLLETCQKGRILLKDDEAGKALKCFIAGSKCLEKERDAIISGVNDYNLANCSTKRRIECYSFQNFDSSLSKEGQQQQYNEFIVNKADLCVFILDEVVGGITKQEFEIAIDTFISSNYNRPTILVFCHKDTNAHGHDKDIEQIKQRMTQLQQYWIDYSDLVNLKNSLQLELYKLYANKE